MVKKVAKLTAVRAMSPVRGAAIRMGNQKATANSGSERQRPDVRVVFDIYRFWEMVRSTGLAVVFLVLRDGEAEAGGVRLDRPGGWTIKETRKVGERA
jgi:hypothetical protein